MIDRLEKGKDKFIEKFAHIIKAKAYNVGIIIDSLIINFFLIAICMVNKIHIINFLVIGAYLYYLTKQDVKRNFFNCIILYLGSKFLVENLWYATHISFNTYILKIQPIVIILLLIKILKVTDIKDFIKDKIFIGLTGFLAFEVIRSILVKSNLSDAITGIYIYGTIIVFYMYASRKKFEYNLFYKIVLILQLPLVLFEFIIYKDQDQITGIFGLHATNWSMIFLAFSIYYTFVLYLEKKVNYKMFLGILGYCFALFMINESKMAFFVIPFCLFIIILISKIDLKKKIAITTTIVVLSLIGMVGIMKIYPSFKNILFNPKNLMNYVFNEKSGIYRYNRLENIEHSNDIILHNSEERLLGKGIGRAIPDREFNLDMYSRGRFYHGTDNSVIYERFGNWGYGQTSFNVMWIEIGVIGVILYFILIGIILKRAISLARKGTDYEDRAVGIGFVGYTIGWMFMYFYSDVFYTFNSNMLFFILAGVVTYKYRSMKKV